MKYFCSFDLCILGATLDVVTPSMFSHVFYASNGLGAMADTRRCYFVVAKSNVSIHDMAVGDLRSLYP
jgi:hypothetical protein